MSPCCCKGRPGVTQGGEFLPLLRGSPCVKVVVISPPYSVAVRVSQLLLGETNGVTLLLQRPLGSHGVGELLLMLRCNCID